MLAAGGEVVIGGEVGGDARLEADAVRLLDGARLLGDLTYTSRKELDQEPGATVAGETRFHVKEEDEEDDDPWFSVLGMFLRIWCMLAAMVVGLVIVALSRRILCPR